MSCCPCRVLPDIVQELQKALDEVNKKDQVSAAPLLLLFLLPSQPEGSSPKALKCPTLLKRWLYSLYMHVTPVAHLLRKVNSFCGWQTWTTRSVAAGVASSTGSGQGGTAVSRLRRRAG